MNTQIEYDFELAFPGIHEDLPAWRNTLPSGYSTEIRGRGYGLILRNDNITEQGQLNEILPLFFTPLLSIAETIRDPSCILRVALYNPFVTTTINLSVANLELLTKFQAQIELSVYPVSEDKEEEETKE